jgi:hypothetical protein
MERKTRGSAITGYFKYIKKKWGQDGLDKCYLDIGLKQDLDETQYYPDELMIDVLKWIRSNYGDEALREGGRFVVKNLGVIAWLVRMASPKFIAKRFQKNMKELYTFGSVEIDDLGEKSIGIRLIDTYAGEERCIAWEGVCKGAMDLTHKKGTVKKKACAGNGGDCCEYVMTWT